MITAIHAHESAHGVVAALVGYDVESVVCSQGFGYVQAGRYRGAHTDNISIKLRMRFAADAAFALSGALGESEYTHEPTRTILARCDDDRRAARRAAVGFALTLPEWHPDLHLEVLDDFLKRTRRLVRSNWGTIQVLAEKLALNGRLGGPDVLRAIELAARREAA